MPGHGRPRPLPLTLVGGSDADDPRRADGARDWSRLMARAQDGDRQAYRTLLEDIDSLSPVARGALLQAGERRGGRGPGCAADRPCGSRHTYDPTRPFGPGSSPSPIAASSTGCAARRVTQSREVVLAAEHETFAEAATNLDEAVSCDDALNEAIERLPPDQRQAVNHARSSERCPCRKRRPPAADRSGR